MSVSKKIVTACLSTAIIIAALLFAFCAEDTPDRCGDGQPLNTYTQFCYGGVTYDKCGGKDYAPSTHFCDIVSGTTYLLCGGKDYTPATEFCFTDIVYEKCGAQNYDPTTERCVFGVVLPQCGNSHYDPVTQFCHNNTSAIDKCNNSAYNYDSLFCHNKTTLYERCGVDKVEYNPLREICSLGVVVDTVTTIRPVVIFDGNGATIDVPGIITTDFDSSITLPPAMVREGHTFAGWGVNSSGQGELYAAGASYTVRKDITLYAIWVVNRIKITFMGNGAISGVPNAIDTIYGANITLPGQGTMTNGELAFDGWSRNAASTGDRFGVNVPYQFTADITLYARWIDPSLVLYRVTFDPNGATSGTEPAPMSTEPGKSVTLPMQVNITRTGYDFGGWNVNRGGTGKNYNNGDSYTITGNDTLYAKWTPTNYTISYTLNNGTVSPANRQSYTIETATFTLNNPTRTGYTFSGWTGTDITTPLMEVTIPLGSTENRSYTANWTATTGYTVTFDGNGATVGVPDAVVNLNYDQIITLPVQGTMTRNGYNFGGWNTNAEGTGTNHAAGAYHTVKGESTLYAKWTLINYTISYTRNGGTESPANPTTYNIETATFTLNNPTRDGWIFSGWTGTNGTTPEMTVTIPLGSTENKSYTANWAWGKGQFNPKKTYGSLIDDRDNQTYRTIEIGTQVWMAENLNYRNTTGESDTVGMCYNNRPDSCAKYGRLYRWVEVMNIAPTYQTTSWGGSDVKHQGICPAGWHVPSDAEWNALIKHIDPTYTSGNHATAGSKLKSQSYWSSYSGISSTDDYGFSALPGGLHLPSGFFDGAGYGGFWWSATENAASHARIRYMLYNDDYVVSSWYNKLSELSLRCLRD